MRMKPVVYPYVLLTGAIYEKGSWYVTGRLRDMRKVFPMEIRLTKEGTFEFTNDTFVQFEFYKDLFLQELEKQKLRVILGKLPKRTFLEEVQYCNETNRFYDNLVLLNYEMD